MKKSFGCDAVHQEKYITVMSSTVTQTCLVVIVYWPTAVCSLLSMALEAQRLLISYRLYELYEGAVPNFLNVLYGFVLLENVERRSLNETLNGGH